MAADRRKDTSEALTEIRTVHSRAWSALDRLAMNNGLSETRRIEASYDEDGEYVPPSIENYRDPDADEMVAALEAFVAATAKWANRKRKGL